MTFPFCRTPFIKAYISVIQTNIAVTESDTLCKSDLTWVRVSKFKTRTLASLVPQERADVLSA